MIKEIELSLRNLYKPLFLVLILTKCTATPCLLLHSDRGSHIKRTFEIDFNAFERASERCERIGGVCTASHGHVSAGSYEFIGGHSLDIRDSPAGA